MSRCFDNDQNAIFNISITLKQLLLMIITTASVEGSFSKLIITKNDLRTIYKD